MVENTKSFVNWIRLTADCREFVRLRGANIQFRLASVEEPTNDNKSKPNKQTRTCYATLLRFMRYRAPKLTARTFYAPLNERSSFDILRETARLIGKNVRRRKQIISAILHREAGTPHLHSKCKGQAPEPLCVP